MRVIRAATAVTATAAIDLLSSLERILRNLLMAATVVEHMALPCMPYGVQRVSIVAA